MEKYGYDVSFVDDLPDYLTCVICQFALRNPVLLVNCGHRICNPCFESMKEHAVRKNIELLCPHDRMNVDVKKVVEDKGINRVVLDLKTKCIYYIDGCQWTGELRNLEAHSQGECRFMEKERTSILLKKLQDRLESFEMHLKENNREIGIIKDQFRQKDKEITMLKERCKHSEEKIASLEKKIEQHGKQSIETNIASKSSYEGTGSAAKYPDAPGITNSHLQFDNLDKEVKLLKQNVTVIKNKHQADLMHIKVMRQVISNKRVVYKWKLQNYIYTKDNNNYVDSANFYSGVPGHCCKLSVEWFGNMHGRLGIFFLLCDGIYDKEISKCLKMGIHFEVVDKTGIKKGHTITAAEIKDLNLKKRGFGCTNFLNMPRLRDFIIDDSFVITCTLTPE